MMQYNFAVELPVSEEWGCADIAGPKYFKVLVNAKGENMSGHFDALSNAALKDVGVPQGNAAVDMTLRYFAKDGLAKARLIVSEQAKKYAEEAANAVEARSEQEYQRMNHLLSMRGKAGTSEALKQLRKNVQERKKIVANPQLRLDAIRLVVCK